MTFSLWSQHLFHPLYWLMSMTAGLIFFADLMIPSSVAGGLPYTAVILLSLRHRDPRLPLWIAAGCSLLTVTGLSLSQPGAAWGYAVMTRIWALLALWITAVLGYVQQQQAQEITEGETASLLAEQTFQSSPDPICVIGSDYRFQQVNQAYLTLHRRSLDQAIGAHVADLAGLQVFTETLQPILDRCLRGEKIREEGWMACKDGKPRYLANSYMPLAKAGKPVSGILMVSRDLTTRKECEEALHASEFRVRTILDSLPHFVGIGSVEGVVMDCNLAPLQLAGLIKEDVIGKFFIDTYWMNHSPQMREHVQQIIQRVAQGEKVQTAILARIDEQSLITVDAWFIPIQDHDGHVRQIVFSGVDVTGRRQVELALQKSKQEFQNLVDSLEGIVWECDFPSYQFTYVSRQAERLIGFPIEQWLTEPDFFCNHLHALDREWALEYCRNQTIQKQNHEMEYRFIHANGDVIWLRDLITVVVEQDQPVKVRGVMFNITHLKQSEDALRKSEERFRTYFEAGLVGMAISSVNKQFLEVNDCLCEMLGYSREALLQCTWAQLTHPDDLPADERQFSRLVAGSLRSYSMAKRLVHQDGHFLEINLYVNAVRNKDGKVEYITAMVQDVSKQKQAEDAVRTSERLALATMNALSAHICVLDERGIILMVNKGWKKFALANGVDPEQLGVGVNYFSFSSTWPPLTAQEPALNVSRMLEVLEGKREEFSYEYACHSPCQHQWFSCRITRFATEGPLRVVVAHQDITEQKEAEWRMREAETFTTSILENLPNMVFVKDAEDLRFVRFNQAGESLLGYSRKQLIGKNDYDFFPEEEADFFTAKDRSVLAAGNMVDIPEEYIHTKHQGVRILHTKKVPLYDQSGNPRFLLGISEDITQQKFVEDALRTSESTLKSFFDNAPLMMGIVELIDGDIQHLSDNKAAGVFFDLTTDTRFPCLASARGIPAEIIQLWIAQFRESQRLGKPLKFEYAHPHQGRLRWVSAIMSPIPNVALPRFAYLFEDITERKLLEETINRHAEELEAEVERRALRIHELEQRRMQVEKMAALSQVAAGIAHEINNPLASIAQSMVILKRALPERHPKYKYIGKIQECIERITHIIQQLYKLYRPEASTQVPMDIRPVIASALEIMLPFAQQREITLTCTLPDHPLLVSISRTDLIQVLCNLIQNALDASSPHSPVTLTVTGQHGMFTISVRDQGAGISPQIASHIFEPFFTTKQGTNKGGMGLGLAVSRSLVEGMKGTLTFTTTPGSGTSFIIRFPETLEAESLESL